MLYRLKKKAKDFFKGNLNRKPLKKNNQGHTPYGPIIKCLSPNNNMSGLFLSYLYSLFHFHSAKLDRSVRLFSGMERSLHLHRTKTLISLCLLPFPSPSGSVDAKTKKGVNYCFKISSPFFPSFLPPVCTITCATGWICLLQ